jgi:hypothetical protein
MTPSLGLGTLTAGGRIPPAVTDLQLPDYPPHAGPSVTTVVAPTVGLGTLTAGGRIPPAVTDLQSPDYPPPAGPSVTTIVAPSVGLSTLATGGTNYPPQVGPGVTTTAAPSMGLGTFAASGRIPTATTNSTSLDNHYPPHAGPRFGLIQPQLPPQLPTHAVLYSPPAIPASSELSAQQPHLTRSLHYSQHLVSQLSCRSSRR